MSFFSKGILNKVTNVSVFVVGIGQMVLVIE